MPAPLTRVVADLHCHTIASTHAYSTVTELARAALQQGLLAIACTDHGPAAPDSPHIWHFGNLDILPPSIEGVRVLHGMEANVTDFDGHLDLPENRFFTLDIVIASMHLGVLGAGQMDACTAAYLALAENPEVDIIGHSGTPAFRYDYETVIPAFGRCGKVVEINETTFRARSSSLDNCRKIAELCKKHGVRVVLDSDAHYHDQVGRLPRCLALLQEIDFPPELVINGSEASFTRFLQEKHLAL